MRVLSALNSREPFFSWEMVEFRWRLASLEPWLLSLFCLNVLDIIVTNPALESNPLTLLMWGKIGFFLSAFVKLSLVFVFGVLCIVAKRVAKPVEWDLTSRLLLGILVTLVAYYLIVVLWNVLLMI